MKVKFIWIGLICGLFLASCSLDNGDTVNINFEVVPVESVEMPATFTFGQTYDIPVTFNRNECQAFEGFTVESELNQRSIGVVVATPEADCGPTDINETRDLRFLVASNGSYVFRFFSGFNQDQEPEYLEYTVIVEE
ncbi:hypothetical protein [Nonlabens xiamenensis]|uniref:hypothetical protein n=1 Tax=Nonlabens xiamenensis TaxID=2341043 RepID=UPI000F60AAD7|nr:hypothetical protein [Nonlabens xiamenensis]